jgi:hypothetical protein
MFHAGKCCLSEYRTEKFDTDLRGDLLRNVQHSAKASIYIVVRRGPVAYTDTHGRTPLPYRASAPAGAFVLNGCNCATRLIVIAERYQYLI